MTMGAFQALDQQEMLEVEGGSGRITTWINSVLDRPVRSGLTVRDVLRKGVQAFHERFSFLYSVFIINVPHPVLAA